MNPILLVCTELEVGGAEKALTEIALRLPELGFAPTIVSLRPRPAGSRDSLVVRLEGASIPVRFLNLTRPTQILGGIRELRRMLRESSATIALSFLFHANVLTGFATARERGVRHFAGIRVAEPSRWRNRLEAWALKRCAGVLCVSNEVKRNFLPYFRDESRMSVIPNGAVPWKRVPAIDLQRIGIAESEKVILFVGRLHPQKGLDWALPHVGKVLEKIGDAHFVILGDGPQNNALERLAVGHLYSDRIHFVGFHKDPNPYYARAHCLLLPSRWEGMPNVVLEAISAGLPVLATRESSAGEIFNSESPAQLFAFGDYVALVDKLTAILSDEKLSQHLSAENRECSRRFLWDEVAAAYARRFSEQA